MPTLCVFTKKFMAFWGPRLALHKSAFLYYFQTHITQVVDFQSASLNTKRSMYLSTDHSGLNKFHGFEDENFQLVLPEIQRMAHAAQMTIKSQFECMFPSVTSHFLVFSAK